MVLTLTTGKVSWLKSTAHPPKWSRGIIRKKLVVDMLNRFLQIGDMPFSCNLCLASTLFSTPRSWIPVVDAQPLLYGWAVGHAAVEVIFLSRCVVPSDRCFAIFREGHEVSKGCSCLTVPSLFSDPRTFDESAARGIDCVASSTGL